MKSRKVIYFDGVCNLCDGFVSFLVTLKPDESFKMTSLQGEFASENLPKEMTENLSSVVYEREGKLLQESAAVIWILSDLKWYFSFLKIFLIVPSFIRDGIYKWVAANRYRFFGKKETCRLPTSEERSYFLP